jgi:excisionase family DNA binding protein
MLTVPEAARRAGCDPETVRRWIRSGRLRSHRVGTQHLIDESDGTLGRRGRAPATGATPAPVDD